MDHVITSGSAVEVRVVLTTLVGTWLILGPGRCGDLHEWMRLPLVGFFCGRKKKAATGVLSVSAMRSWVGCMFWLVGTRRGSLSAAPREVRRGKPGLLCHKVLNKYDRNPPAAGPRNSIGMPVRRKRPSPVGRGRRGSGEGSTSPSPDSAPLLALANHQWPDDPSLAGAGGPRYESRGTCCQRLELRRGPSGRREPSRKLKRIDDRVMRPRFRAWRRWRRDRSSDGCKRWRYRVIRYAGRSAWRRARRSHPRHAAQVVFLWL